MRLAQTFVDCAPNQLNGTIDVERLWKVFEGTTLESGNRTFEVRKRRHDDHGKRRMLALDGTQQLDAAFSGHADVGDEYLGTSPVKFREHLLGRTEGAAWKILASKCLFEHPANRPVVIDDPDRFHVSVRFDHLQSV